MGTGLKQNRLPAGWESQPIQMTVDPKQGPSALRSTGAPQGTIPDDVTDVFEQAGGFLAQHLAGRPGMQKERAQPGDSTNVSGSIAGFPGPDLVSGSASRTTGNPVIGQTSGKGTI